MQLTPSTTVVVDGSAQVGPNFLMGADYEAPRPQRLGWSCETPSCLEWRPGSRLVRGDEEPVTLVIND